MKAWSLASHGGPEALRLAELPDPQPGPGEMVVRVAVAALNFSDLLMVRGTYQIHPALPFTPGQEIAGIVETCPGGAFRRGERIASKVPWGGFAQRAAVREDMAIRLPETIDFETGATLLPK